MDVDAASISHGTNNPRRDTASTSTDQPVRLPAANAAPVSNLASQSKTTAIPSKRSYPFVKKKGDEARKMKRKKTVGYIDVRIYAERKDLEHTHEIRCALTTDGGLDLVSLSHRMNFTACQASRLDIILWSRPCLSSTGSGCSLKTLVWQASGPGKGRY
jgi:hypothetical protein